ncbi:MAG TPA: hypothetical protein VF407_23025 [Polyangiaceae bacterium]
MATDQSPPRIKLIVSVGIGTVVTLILLKPIFDSYYFDTMESIAQAKMVAPEEVVALHAEEAKKLTTSPAIPIDQAMADLAQKGRLSAAGITPTQSNDTGAVTGWQHLHDGENPATTSAAAATDGGATTTMAAATDAGTASATGDAGLMQPGNDQDAGAPHATNGHGSQGMVPAHPSPPASMTAGSPASPTEPAPGN